MPTLSNSLVPEDFDLRYQRSFALLAFSVNRHLMDHMRRISTELAIDLEMAQIWGTLAHMNMLPNLPLSANPMDVLNEIGKSGNIGFTPLRLSELTQIIGLPRETLRRKLERLEAAGKVARTDDGRWVYCSSGTKELEIEFTRKTVLLFLQTAQALRKRPANPVFPNHGRLIQSGAHQKTGGGYFDIDWQHTGNAQRVPESPD